MISVAFSVYEKSFEKEAYYMGLLENGIAKESQGIQRIFSTVFYTTKKELGTQDNPFPNPWYSEVEVPDSDNPGRKKMEPIKVFVANVGDGEYGRVLGFRPRNVWAFGYLKESYTPGDARKQSTGGDTLIFPPVLQHIAARDGVPFGEGVMSMGDVEFFSWNVRKELKEYVIPKDMPFDVQRSMNAFLLEGKNSIFRSGIGYYITGVALVELSDKSRKMIPALYRFDSMTSVDWVRNELFPALEVMEGDGLLRTFVVRYQRGDANEAMFAGLDIKDENGNIKNPIMPKGMEAELKEVYDSLAEKEEAWAAGFVQVAAQRKHKINCVYGGQSAVIEVYKISKEKGYLIPVKLFEPRGAAVEAVLTLKDNTGTREALADSRPERKEARVVERNDPRKAQSTSKGYALKDGAKPVEGNEWEEPISYDPTGEEAPYDTDF